MNSSSDEHNTSPSLHATENIDHKETKNGALLMESSEQQQHQRTTPIAPSAAPSRLNASVIDPLADFVVVAEFSEKEGPISRCIVGPHRDRFPIDQFVLRIMSVELSVEGHEKWSVWMDWAAQGVEAIIVHFQLSDLYARGYVRPLAIAYISSYPMKLVRYRTMVLRSLYAAADAMLNPNRILFRQDIQQRLQDLNHMKQSLLHPDLRVDSTAVGGNPDHHSSSLPSPSLSLEQAEDSIQELEQLLFSIPLQPGQQGMGGGSQQGEDGSAHPTAHAPTEDTQQEEHRARLARIESLQRKNSLYDKHLRNLDELTHGAFSSVARLRLDATVKSLQHQPQVLLHDQFSNIGGSLAEWGAAAPAPTQLCIGPTPLLNFHLDSESHFVESNSFDAPESDVDSEHLISIAGLLWPSSVVGSTQTSPHISTFNFLFAIAQKVAADFGSSHPSGPATAHSKPPTLLELLRGKYSWMKHCLFSLLKGRPVIILAETHNALAVAHAVDLLHSFVPGGFGNPNQRPRIIPWWPATSTPVSAASTAQTHWLGSIGGDIKIPHLGWIKLAGVDKRCNFSRVMERYVSVWDWEADTLRAPPYNLDDGEAQSTNMNPGHVSSTSSHPQSSSSGTPFDASIFSTPYLTPQPGGRVLDALLLSKKGWPSNSTFRAHIHHTLFTEFALKAALYYHVCCLAVPPSQTPSATAPHRLATLPKSRSMTDLAQHQSVPSVDASAHHPLSGAQPVAAAASLALRERARAAFFLRMNVHEQDAEIIEYLAETVKMQQVQQEHQASATEGDVHDVPIRLDLSPARLFKNTSATASSNSSSTSANASAAAAIASMMI